MTIALSHRTRDAIRLGVQSTCAAGAVYLGMLFMGLPEIFVGTLSAVLILSVSADGSVGAGIDHVIGTLVGSAIAIICLLTLPYVWGNVLALGTAVLTMSILAQVRPRWQYGLVAAIALAIGSESNLFDTTVDRLIAIGIGVVVGIAVSALVWPERAITRYRRHRRAAIRALIARLDRLEHAAADTTDHPVNVEADRQYHHAFGLLVDTARAKPFGPIPHAEEEISRFRRIYNSLILLDRALEETERDTADFEPMIDRLRTRLENLLEGDPETFTASGGEPGQDAPEQSPDATRAVLQSGVRNLTFELDRLEALQRP